MLDSIPEKQPQHRRIDDGTNDIPGNDLRTNSPPVEAKIARVTKPAVDIMLDEDVSRRASSDHVVIEICACDGHCPCTDCLTADNHDQPSSESECSSVSGIVPARAGRRDKHRIDQQDLQHGAGVGDVPSPSIGTEQEVRRNPCDRGVVASGGIELEKVKNAQRGDEERESPDLCKVVVPREEIDYRADRTAGYEAEKRGVECDCAERADATMIEARIHGLCVREFARHARRLAMVVHVHLYRAVPQKIMVEGRVWASVDKRQATASCSRGARRSFKPVLLKPACVYVLPSYCSPTCKGAR